MEKKEEMTKKAEKILNRLYFAKREADSFVDRLPDPIHKRIACSLWHEQFVSVLYEKEKRKNWVMKGLQYLATGTGLLQLRVHQNKEYKSDILILYGSTVHKSIVKELVSMIKKEGVSVVEVKDYALTTTERVQYFMKGMKYLMDKEVHLLSGELYLSFMHYLGVIAPHKPKIVITFKESSSTAGLISYICTLLGSQSVNIAHAVSARTPLYQNSPFDYHLVYGEKSKYNIEEAGGIIDGELIPIGALKMDNLFNQNTSGSFTQKILIVGSWKGHFLDDIVDYMYTLVSEAVKTSSFTFVYKPHPLEVGKRDAYSKKFRMPNCVILPPDSDLLQVIDSVDMVVLGWSAVGLEAAIRGKPVIVVNPCNIPDWLSYIESGYGVNVSSAEELHTAIKMVYDNYDYYRRKAQEFVDIHLSNQGKATAETCRFLLNILKKYRIQ